MNAGELTAYMDVDLGRFDRGIDQAETKGKQFERKTWTSKVDVDTTLAQSKLGALSGLVAQHSDQMVSAGTKLSLGVTLPVMALDAMALSAASNLNEARNKATVVFDESAADVMKWGENAAEAIGQSERQALGAAGTFGNLFVSMDMGSKQAAGLSMNLVTLASDLASFHNATPDEAMEALRSGLVGETEPLRRFGVNMNEATLKAQALAMGLEWTGDTLPPLIKAEAAYALIMEQTATAQGDRARTMDDLANATRTVTAESEDLAASWGEELVPVGETVLSVAHPLLDFFKDLPDPIKQATIVLSTLAAAAGPAIWSLGQIGKAVSWVGERTAKTTSDTAAIAANTAAVEANTIARGKNALAPAVGSGTVPTGGGYLAKSRQMATKGASSRVLMQSEAAAFNPALAGGGAAAAGAGGALSSAAVSAGIAAAMAAAGAAVYFLGYKPYKEALDQQQQALDDYSENVVNRIDMLKVKYGEGSHKIREYAQIVNEDLTNMEESHQNWWTRGMNWTYGPLGLDLSFGGLGEQDSRVKAIVEEVQGILEAGAVQPGSSTEGRLRKLYKELTSIKDPSDAAKKAIATIGAELEALAPGALLTAAESAEMLAAEAKLAAEEVSQLASQFDNLQDATSWIAQLSLAELNEQMSTLGQLMAEVSGAAAREKADKMLKKRYKNGIDWSQVPDRVTGYASGGDFVTNGPELILVGDNPSGKERVTVTPSEAGAGQSGVHVTNKVYASFIDMPTQSQLDRLGDALGQRTVEKVLDALAVN